MSLCPRNQTWNHLISAKRYSMHASQRACNANYAQQLQCMHALPITYIQVDVKNACRSNTQMRPLCMCFLPVKYRILGMCEGPTSPTSASFQIGCQAGQLSLQVCTFCSQTKNATCRLTIDQRCWGCEATKAICSAAAWLQDFLVNMCRLLCECKKGHLASNACCVDTRDLSVLLALALQQRLFFS
jgi:hypothetical protein